MRTMKDLFFTIRNRLDGAWLMEETERLWKLELGQRNRDQRAAARYAESLLRRCGLQSVERRPLPADGRTTFKDRTQPLAWNISHARLTLVSAPDSFEFGEAVKKSDAHLVLASAPDSLDDHVLADYARHPFHVVYGSVAAPRGGVEVPLIFEDELRSGVDGRGAMIMLGPATRPSGATMRAIRKAGALGFVSDFITDRYITPDSLPWINGCSEGNHWQVHADDGPFIGFTVTPRVGDALREALRQGAIRVRVESDGRRFAGQLDVVTGLLPGSDQREYWIKAHLYEPLAEDNTAGVVGAAGLARALLGLFTDGSLPKPRFSLRLVFAQELYGFAAYEEQRGGMLRDSVLGALNFDAQPLLPALPTKAWLAPSGSPSFGDYVMEAVLAECAELTRIPLQLKEEGNYFDDQEAADPTVGIPSYWCFCKRPLWHNSAQIPSTKIDPECFRDALALQGVWLATMLGLTAETMLPWQARTASLAGGHLLEEARRISQAGKREQALADHFIQYRLEREEARLQQGEKICPGTSFKAARAMLNSIADKLPRPAVSKKPPALLSEEVGSLVYTRATRGLPLDLARIPKEERFSLPDAGLYGPFVRVVALLDGRRSLEEVIQRAGWEARDRVTPERAANYAQALERLARHGYLRPQSTARKGPPRKSGGLPAAAKKPKRR